MTTSPEPTPPGSTSSGVPDAPLLSSGAVPSGGSLSGDPDASAATWGFPDAVQTTAATPLDVPRAAAKPRAGRRPGAVWGYFTPVRTEQNKTHAVCRFCARRCAGVAARMATHLLTKCPGVPAPERDAISTALAHDGGPPPEKRQRTSGSSSATTAGDKDTEDALAVASALQLIAVACLRTRAPLALVEDAFFRDAMALLRPHALAAITSQSADAAALRKNVHEAVARDAAHWARASKSFTLVHNHRTREWRGADSLRRGALLAEAAGLSTTPAWRAEIETILELLRDDAIVGLCCDSDLVYNQAVAPASAPSRIKLVNKCLLNETARLWTLVADALPLLESEFIGAAEMVQTYATSTAIQDASLAAEPTSYKFHLVSGWSLPFRVVKRANAMARALQSLELDKPSAATTRTSLGKQLHAVDALLAPFAWIFALSESKSVSSGQIALGWLWLLATLETSPLVPSSTEKNQAQQQTLKPLTQVILTAVTQGLEDHILVAFLLDPRIRGAGLSATGRRKVKTLVVHVARRLWPTKFEPQESQREPAPAPSTPTPARQALLEQLTHYVDKTGCFADDVVWEMASGAAPETFWRDYAQDAPELSALALAVLTHVPVASQTSELLLTAQPSDEQLLDARQIRFHFERNRKHGAFEMASVVAAHAELLVPAESAAALSPLHPTTETTVAVPRLVETVRAELERLRAVVRDGNDAGALAATVAHDDAADASWFALQSDTGEREMAAALRRVLPASLTAALSPPSTAALIV